MAPRQADDGDTRPSSAPPLTRVSKSVAKPKRRPGRPFKFPRKGSYLSQSSQSPLSALSTLSASPAGAPPIRRRALSRLEALPVEVIEKIFLYSLNPNLPRASPVLAVALSREHIYKLLIILALWNDPMATGPLSPAMAALLTPLEEYVPLSWDARAKLQESIFRCQWCTVNRVLDQIPQIVNLTLHRIWINTDLEMDSEQQAALDRFMKRDDMTNISFTAKSGTTDRLADGIKPEHPRQNHDPTRHALSPYPHEYELIIEPNVLIYIKSTKGFDLTLRPAIELQEFPSHFLRGSNAGFSAEDVAFLELLRLCSNHRQWDERDYPRHLTSTKVDRMALHQGVRNAIRSQNLDALTSLLKIDQFVYDYQVREESEKDILPYTIPSDHFVTVTRVGRSNPRLNLAFFETLVRASAESIPTNSLEVTQWTVDNIHLAEQNPSQYRETNGNFARWLSNFILRLPLFIEREAGLYQTLFQHGKLDLSQDEGRRYHEEVLQPRNEQLLYWMAESSFHPEEFWLKSSGAVSKPDV